jgi:Rad3-related DNA helicase
MFEDLFDLTLEVSKSVKGGILVFFTSYAMMREYLAYWKITGLLRKFKE